MDVVSSAGAKLAGETEVGSVAVRTRRRATTDRPQPVPRPAPNAAARPAGRPVVTGNGEPLEMSCRPRMVCAARATRATVSIALITLAWSAPATASVTPGSGASGGQTSGARDLGGLNPYGDVDGAPVFNATGGLRAGRESFTL